MGHAHELIGESGMDPVSIHVIIPSPPGSAERICLLRGGKGMALVRGSPRDNRADPRENLLLFFSSSLFGKNDCSLKCPNVTGSCFVLEVK